MRIRGLLIRPPGCIAGEYQPLPRPPGKVCRRFTASRQTQIVKASPHAVADSVFCGLDRPLVCHVSEAPLNRAWEVTGVPVELVSELAQRLRAGAMSVGAQPMKLRFQGLFVLGRARACIDALVQDCAALPGATCFSK